MARPKRQFTDKDEEQIYKYALSGCQNGTIATLMCIPLTTLIRRFGSVLREKRAERKYNLRKNQTELTKNNPAMAIFLGKNELGQIDKIEHIEKTEPIKPLTVTEKAIIQEAASKILLLQLNEPQKAQESA